MSEMKNDFFIWNCFSRFTSFTASKYLRRSSATLQRNTVVIVVQVVTVTVIQVTLNHLKKVTFSSKFFSPKPFYLGKMGRNISSEKFYPTWYLLAIPGKFTC